jgi:Transposase and inactivated derivatives
MGRRPRLQSADVHYHVIVRCNNQAFRFETHEDFSIYLKTLALVQRKHRFKLFNYELMNTHVHLFLQPSQELPLARTMQLINWKYAKSFNQRKNRKGHFWLARYQNIPVQSGRYALALMRYINRNPVRARMVEKPGQWTWSGYPALALGKHDALITEHPIYLVLGSNPKERQRKYEDYVNRMKEKRDKRNPKFSEEAYIGSENFGMRLMKQSKNL